MIDLLRFSSLRYFGAHKLRIALAFLAIALGVALFVSSYVTNYSVVRAIEETRERLSGKAEWQVTRGHSLGVEEALLAPIRQIPGAIAAPVIQVSTPLVKPAGETMLILGIEFLNDSMLRLYKVEGKLDAKTVLATALVPRGIVIARSFAARHNLRVGSRLAVETNRGPRDLAVTGLLADEGPARVFDGNFALMDLHAAQRLFRQPGKVDRIEVAGTSRIRLEEACPGASVEPIVATSSMITDALSRVKALIIVSVMALLVGLFIIHNTVEVSIVERVKDIGTMRALGATRGQVLALLLLEWLAIGVLGSAAGIGLGYELAQALVGFTSRAVNVIIPLVNITTVAFPPLAGVAAFAVGVGTTLAGAYGPARHALAVPVIEAVRPHSYRLTRTYRPTFVRGLVLVAVGGLLVSLIRRFPFAGLVAIGLIFWGVALTLPMIVLEFAHGVRLLFRKLSSLVVYLAADNIVKFPQRTALTVVTLGGVLGMMVATATLIEGMRVATARWLVEAYPFDYAVTSTSLASSLYSQHTVPRSLVEQIRGVEGVTSACGIRAALSDYQGEDILVMGIETVPFLEMHRRRGLNRWARPLGKPESVSRLRSGGGVFISENLAYFFGLRTGETILFRTPSGARSALILGTLEDYSWPHGVIVMDLDVMARYWNDDDITYVGIETRPGIPDAALRARIEGQFRGLSSVFLYSMPEIRRLGIEILDQTVDLVNIQVLIAISIGSLGIANTLLISVLQRSREIGLLRAVGMTRRQIALTVILEGVLVAVIGCLVGVVEGLIAGWGPVRLFELSITGYLTPVIFPWRQVLAALAMAIGVGVVASVVPARRAARLNILDAIGYE